MNRLKLSDAAVKGLKCPPGKQGVLFTDIGGGLTIYVSPASKIWRYRYSFAGKLRSPLVIGKWPGVDAAEARAKAAEFEALLRQGRDPRMAKYDPKSAPTLNDVLDQYEGKLTNESTKRSVKSNLKPLREAWGETRIAEFNKRIFRDWIDANYEGRPGAARLMIRYVSAAFTMAQDEMSAIRLPEGSQNPASRLRKHVTVLEGHSYGSYAKSFEPDDVAKMLRGIEAAYATKNLHEPGVMVLHLLLLTGARPSEIKTLKWSEIVSENGVTRIIKNRHKTWKKTGRPRQILVMGEAEAVLERAMLYRKRVKYRGEYVFPQRRNQANQKREYVHQLGNYTDRVSKLAGVEFIPYNLRSGFINFALDTLGYEYLEEVAENVGHTDTKTTLTFYRKHRESKLVDIAKRVDAAFAKLKAA